MDAGRERVGPSGPAQAFRACPLARSDSQPPRPPAFGAVAQLGERRFCKPEVVGSIPISSIMPGDA